MTRSVPVLDPNAHVKAATPEKLARTLIRPLRAGVVGNPIWGNQVAPEKVSTDQSGNHVPHLIKRV